MYKAVIHVTLNSLTPTTDPLFYLFQNSNIEFFFISKTNYLLNDP